MPKITSFEDLECWKEGVALSVQIYRVSNQGELAKDFGLRDQIRKRNDREPHQIPKKR